VADAPREAGRGVGAAGVAEQEADGSRDVSGSRPLVPGQLTVPVAAGAGDVVAAAVG
jgi:hypothetical protein